MNRREHLLTILAEEATEVAHAVSKALRFGMEEVKPDLNQTNAERITAEIHDLIAVYDMLRSEGAFKPAAQWDVTERELAAKRKKVVAYLHYSKSCGTFQGEVGE